MSADDARARFDAGDYRQAHELASAGLADQPEDVELLRVAGRAGVELGDDAAIERLRKVAELQPDDAESWSDLGDAYATEGRMDEATEAFRKAVELNPEDELALTHLGHSAFASGHDEDGVSALSKAAERSGGMSTATIGLVEMYKELGQPEEALTQAQKLAEADPEDGLALLDVAELALETGQLDEAASAFARLRDVLELPEDQVGALQGAIKVELAREQPERGLELAREASAIDSIGRTAGVLAHLEAEVGSDETPEQAVARGATTVFLRAQEVPPTRDEVDALLEATLADLRRGLRGEARMVKAAERG